MLEEIARTRFRGTGRCKEDVWCEGGGVDLVPDEVVVELDMVEPDNTEDTVDIVVCAFTAGGGRPQRGTYGGLCSSGELEPPLAPVKSVEERGLCASNCLSVVEAVRSAGDGGGV